MMPLPTKARWAIHAANPAQSARRQDEAAQDRPQTKAASAPVTAPTNRGMTLVWTNQSKKIEIMKRDRKIGFFAYWIHSDAL